MGGVGAIEKPETMVPELIGKHFRKEGGDLPSQCFLKVQRA